MSIKEKIEQIKDKAAQVAVKTAAVATLMSGGTAMMSSCMEENEEKAKTEKVQEEKTSVVFRAANGLGRSGGYNKILFEDGTSIESTSDASKFLEAGDTVTYEQNEIDSDLSNIKAVRYKDGSGKKVNFGKIGKVGKDITD